MVKGKTQRDRENGAFEKNRQNKAERAAWQQAMRANGHREAIPFPAHTCNGKRNRFLK